MLLGVPNPGSWQIFLQRPDNINLSIQEAKQKYLRELALFEAEKREKENLYLQMIKKLGAGSTGNGPAFGGFSGQGIDGPIARATVLAVAEGITTTTDANGFFTFNFIPSGDIELTGGTDTVTGVAFTGTLKAPKGSTIISPITTAIKEIMDTGKSENQATAEFFEFAAKVYDINIPASKRERIKKENFIDLAAGDGDFLKVVGLATTLESAAEVAGEAAHRAASGKTLNKAKESFYSQIGSLCRDNDFLSISTDENSKNTFKNTLMRVDSNVSTTNAQAIREALDNQLSRVKEIVNDSNMDKEFGVTSIMAQNRLAKREIKADVTALYAGTYTTTQIKTRSEDIVQKEAEEYQNLGTIFEGTTNKEEPSSESQSNLYPEAVDYVTVNGENKYAQGELTRSLSTKINELPTYSGTINGESTFLWYSKSDKVWVIDNNLEAPYTAPADSKRSYPITGNYTNRSTESIIIIALPGVYEDQPAGGGGEENTIGGLAAKNAIQWAEVDKGTLDEKTGATTWQVSGKIYPSIINKGETSVYFNGAFTITLNAKSEQYVIGLGAKGASIVDGKTTTGLTAFNMGITLNKGQVINSTEGYTPSLVSGTYT
jgi:hypothetical protein